ncbi:hydroxyacylglutathione hydrolase [Aliidiomarina iranensis]|uniref:Hydroxyacylglutathione hydrolase n=1 Tax=Aliidiomarina iranensis TaxID=1434071 RepID=A0A432W158_9GAMM|nr:hydroxyacylglutathione hydrolase [Aliidiomarina iranensis]RUO22641.1 hydroxyacylglutathione hydrolase [Aliidiomarina iranensis]
MRIAPISAFDDNYIWSITASNSNNGSSVAKQPSANENPRAMEDNAISKNATTPCVIVDPGDAEPVFQWLKDNNCTVSAILVTHHHYDHTGGVNALKDHFNCPVYGPHSSKTDVVTQPLKEGEQIALLDEQLVLDVIQCPGHTLDHIAFYGAPYLFCGDTLFAGGCGRMFEGEPTEYLESLNKLAALPADTQIYCAHEYTLANLTFAAAVEPNNQAIQQRIAEVKALRAQDKPTLPAELALEHATNPFLRTHLPSVQQAAEQHSGKVFNTNPEVFACIRDWKNNF